MDASRELLVTMAVVAAGAMLGRVQVHGVRLDMAAMLLVGVGAAHLGATVSPALGLFGLLLFVYAVGVQAGPAIRSVRRDDLRLAAGGLAVLAAALSVTLVTGGLMGLPMGVTVGSFAGFVSSGAALAVAEGRWGSALPAAGFAVAAPAGTLLTMLLVQSWNRRIRGEVGGELEAWSRALSSREVPIRWGRIQVTRPGGTLRTLRPACQVVEVERGMGARPLEADALLEAGDILWVRGTRGEISDFARRVGVTVPGDRPPARPNLVVRKYFVSNPDAIGVRLEALALRGTYQATLTRVRRSGVNLRPGPGLRLLWGDRVQVSLPVEQDVAVRKLFGDDAQRLERSSFARAALVIFAGGILGGLPVTLAGGQELRVGPAFGVLLLSLLTSAVHRTGPLIWSQPLRTTQLLGQIGLPLFLVQVGNASYGSLVSAGWDHGLRLLALSAMPVLVVVVGALLAGRALGLGRLATLAMVPPVSLNTPAFLALQASYRETLPAQIYAAVYPFVSIGLLLFYLVLQAF
jgi:putative transport protein